MRKTCSRRGELVSEELFHVVKMAIIVLVGLLIIGIVASLLFKADIGAVFGGG